MPGAVPAGAVLPGALPAGAVLPDALPGGTVAVGGGRVAAGSAGWLVGAPADPVMNEVMMWFSCAKESRIPWSEAAATAPPALGETATENVLRAMRRLALRRAAQLFLPRGYIEGCGLEGKRASSGLRALRRVPAWCPRGTKFQQRRANPAAAVHSCLQSLAQGQGSWSSRKPVDQEGLHLPFRDPFTAHGFFTLAA